jgi:uncharacterized protein (TIGR02217 family)
MALIPLNWAVLPGGNAANGGGFDPTVASPGTDYSQQNSPQFTYTDLVISGSTLTSAAFPFSSLIPGNLLHITGGTGFTTGWYRCLSVAGVVVTLDRSPGTNGSTGGGGKLGGAFAKPDDVNTPIGSIGGTVYCVGTTFTIGSTGIAVTAGGADNAPLTFIGSGTTRGDGTQAVFTCNASDPTIAMDFQATFTIVRGFKLNGNSIAATGINLAQVNSSIANCWATNCNSNGIKLMNDSLTAFRCKVDNLKAGTTGSGGFFLSRFCRALFCESLNNTGNGFASSNQFYEATFCAAYNNTKSGFYTFGGAGMILQNCDSYGNTLDGARWDATGVLTGSMVINCFFGANAGYGLRSMTTDYSVAANAQIGLNRFWNNAFWNNTLGSYFQMPAGTGDILPLLDPTTGADNFKLNLLVTGGALLNGTGIGALGLITAAQPTVTALSVGCAQFAGTAPTVVTTPGTTAPTIDELQFPTDISENAQGGPVWSTIVVEAGNGTETRIPEMSISRYEWNIAPGLKSIAQMNILIAFWLARKGRARGFRFKDWFDYTATNEALVITGSQTTQLIKTYSDGLLSYVRNIFKPQTNLTAITIKKNAVSYSAWTADTTTGIITWTAIIAKTITAITAASSAVITVGASHGFVVGDTLVASGVVGMTQINGVLGVVTVAGSTTVTVNINSSGFTAYSSGGTLSKYPQPSDTVTWSGEFDIPARFDIDQMQIACAGGVTRSWDSLPVVEILGSS